MRREVGSGKGELNAVERSGVDGEALGEGGLGEGALAKGVLVAGVLVKGVLVAGAAAVVLARDLGLRASLGRAPKGRVNIH